LSEFLLTEFFLPSPVLILHPQQQPDGGLTQLTVRALRELAVGAGAREASVWVVGGELTVQEPLDGVFRKAPGLQTGRSTSES